MSPDAFWEQTPRTLQLVIKGRQRAVANEFAGRAWLAWHAAYLPNFKKRPDLREFMGLDKKIEAVAKPSGAAGIALSMRKWAVAMAWSQPPAGQILKQR
jgi:hypothetical protein